VKDSTIVVEQGEIVASILRDQISPDLCTVIAVHDIATFEALTRTHPRIVLALVDIDVMTRDERGQDRPFWQLLANRATLTMPLLYFTGNPEVKSDTPLFTPPSDTLTVASPPDFAGLAQVIHTYVKLFECQPLLYDILGGVYSPSLTSNFAEIDAEGLFTLISLGAHSGIIIVRDGIHTGFLACENGQIIHAITGVSRGKEAFCTIFTWRNARFAFYQGLHLGERSMNHGIENLVLEANRVDDEVSEFEESLPPNSMIRRIKGFTDQLPGRRLTLNEWEILSLVEGYHSNHAYECTFSIIYNECYEIASHLDKRRVD
jgi:hypothetical protein